MPRSENVKESHAPSVFASEIDGFTSTSKLSRRETDIVVSLIRNITNSEEIAKSLGISTHTVNNHLKSIFEKTSTKSKTEILSSFLRFAADRLQSRNLFVRRPKVLVIDDEAMICEFVATGLRDRGLRTYTLTEPDRAVEMISKFNVDFVVCDIRMPAMNGMDVLRQVRATYKAWPYFIFITGYPDYSIEECMHYGAAGFIEKPLDIDRLFRTIMGHLVESGDEKVALLQIDASAPVVLDSPCALEADELGFGGAFLPLDPSLQKKHKLGVGTVVDVTLAPAKSGGTLRVRGQVVWKRATKDDGLKTGVGLKFIELSDRDQALFEDLLRHSDTTSFIPLGKMAGSAALKEVVTASRA
jgi:DNA-binding NarL/FixJ family response regulator